VKKIRTAIIGQGRSGRGIHGAYMNGDRRYEIVAAVDPLKERRDRAAAEFGCEVHADHKPLLKRKDLDLIVNTTPSHLHVPVTLEFLKARFDVVCEKPLANRARDVDKLIAAARKARRKLAVFQQNRFNPGFQQMLKVIRGGVLGRIVQVNITASGFSRRWDWQTLKARHGGSLLNTGPHLMDQALQVFGAGAMPEVFCHMDRATTFGDAEDHVVVTLRGPNRPSVVVEISSCCTYGTDSFRVYGTQGGLTGGAAHLDWKYYRPREAPKQKLVRAPIVNADGLPAYCREQLKLHERSWDLKKGDQYASPTATFYKLLHKTLTAGAPLAITPEEIRRQIAVIEICQKQNPRIYGGRK